MDQEPSRPPLDLPAVEAVARDMLPGLLGIEVLRAERGHAEARLCVERRHLAPNGYLHAASVVGLADTACGYGCAASLPAGASGFTTIELKTSFLSTATTGVLECRATARHEGRTTQVWDAEVVREDGRLVALFRCTQLLLSS